MRTKPKIFIKPNCNIKLGLEYLSNDSVILDLPFIHTIGKKLTLGMPCLKLEGKHIDEVRLLDIWDENGYVFIKIQDLKTHKVNTLSWIIQNDMNYWLWSLADFNN